MLPAFGLHKRVSSFKVVPPSAVPSVSDGFNFSNFQVKFVLTNFRDKGQGQISEMTKSSEMGKNCVWC